jgi:methylase of polypeptide subunit release factors
MVISPSNIQLCGFDIKGYVKRENGSCIYQALDENGNRVFVRVIGLQEVITDNNLDYYEKKEYPVSHEIIVSFPPYPADLNEMMAREFPVQLDGKIHWFHLRPGVRKPGYWSTTAIRVSRKVLKRLGKKPLKILDLGCGCGVIGVFLGLEPNIEKVVFSDIDPNAIGCTSINAARNNLERFEIRTGNLFSALEEGEKFDLIIFGPPFFPDIIKTDYRIADIGGPTGRELAEKYSKNVSNYLKDEGFSITYLADYIGYGTIQKTLEESGLQNEIEIRDILYPYKPKYSFPQSNEILWRKELESFYGYKFTDQIIYNKAFLGFKMIHFISRQKK